MTNISFGGHDLVLHSQGGLLWPARQMLILSDLHLEKGSHFARRGFFLPPYDTHETLARAIRLCADVMPRHVLLLGDCFHDPDGYARMALRDRALFDSFRNYDPIWINGNHDRDFVPPGFSSHDEFALDGLTFRHQADADGLLEISGHFHPKADIVHKGALISRPCFIEDSNRLMLPAFGAYTGGLSVTSPPIRALFPSAHCLHVLGGKKIYSFRQA